MSLILALGTTAVAYVYPLYATYKVLASVSHRARPSGQDDGTDEQPTELSELETWTMYWCVMALFWLVDAWLGWTFRWVALYAHAKFLFVCWLALPQTRGASVLYTSYMEPFLSQHEGDLEDILEAGRAKAQSLLSTTVRVVTQIVRSEFLASPEESAEPVSSQPENASKSAEEVSPPSGDVKEMARSMGATRIHWLADAAHAASHSLQPPPTPPPRRKLPRFRRKEE
ncbi:hypothetical protein MNAN1_000015 [Malassezia nana]|uniref:Protein YOP1 n=1 Tax=Malassezia nana TaxID=180528 RepID=A0AAF0EIR3_9BASI|nr:hypothetical protein MNAN1_000015 [Malassezia nana]